MKTLIDLMAGLVAMLAAAALSQFGIDLNRPNAPIEVKRLADSEPAETPSSAPAQDKQH